VLTSRGGLRLSVSETVFQSFLTLTIVQPRP
jgi:hypothetical protein